MCVCVCVCVCVFYANGRVAGPWGRDSWSVEGERKVMLNLCSQFRYGGSYEQALVSLKLKKSVDAEGGHTFAVIIEGG